MRGGEKEPLYRKVNTTARGVHHGRGGEYRWQRNTKGETLAREDALVRGRMQQGLQHGLDYTPLFRFLLSKVGQDWDRVHSEAVSRLDREEPIFWMVALREEDRRPFFCYGESSFFSGMWVDAENRLALVDPALTVADMIPGCGCCTHTLNGKPFTRKYDPAARP